MENRRQIFTSEIKEENNGELEIRIDENKKVEVIVDDDTVFDLESENKKSMDILDKNQVVLHQNKKGNLLIDVGSSVGVAPMSNFTIFVDSKFSNMESFGRLIHFVNGFDDKDLEEGQIKFLKRQHQGFELFIEILIRYTKKIIKEGIYRTYISIQEDIPYLKGKLLLLPTEYTGGQLLNNARFNLQFSCQHDEYSANNIENQILLYTLKFCKQKTKLDVRKNTIQRLINEIDYDVDTLPFISSEMFMTLQYTQLNQRYEDSINFCKMILENSGMVNLKRQDFSFIPPFFVRMDDIFQKFVAHLLKNPEYYPFYTKDDKSTSTERETTRLACTHGTVGHENKRFMFPDIIAFEDKEKKQIHSILDAKYTDDFKNLDDSKKNGKIGMYILYQIAFYLNDHFMKKKIGYAILPKSPNSKDYNIKSNQQRLEIGVRHIDIDETLEWIFNKTTENTEKIKKMLIKKLP